MSRAQPIFFTASARVARQPQPRRVWLLSIATGLFVSAAAALMGVVGVLTLFQARGLYRGLAAAVSRGVLWMHGIGIAVHRGAPPPDRQAVYISNHSSTLDLFVLVALGLPDCRFFLSGFLRKVVPLGIISWMIGTFYTVPQDRPDERRRIFERAARTLRRTGESVYLSPEGGRITTGSIGPFNKGAFHLATDLAAPIVPLYIRIPATVDPGGGFDARPGTIDVFFLPAIDTGGWQLADLAANTARCREVLRCAQQELSCRS